MNATVVVVAALAVAALSLSIAAGVARWATRTLERKDRVHEQRVSMLLDRVMHVVNKTWEPPPYAKGEDEEQQQRDREHQELWAGIVEHPEYSPVTADEPVEPELVFDIPNRDLT